MTDTTIHFPHKDDPGLALIPEKPSKSTRPRSMAELFRIAARFPTHEQRVEYLQQHRHPAIVLLLRYVLDPRIQFTVAANLPFSPAKIEEQSASLYSEVKRLYIWATDPERKSPLAHDPHKQQRLFVDLLESLMPDEAQLLITVSRKQLPAGIEMRNVLEAYPELNSREAVTDHRANASRVATDNLRIAVQEANKEMARLDEQIRSAQSDLDRLINEGHSVARKLNAAKSLLGSVL